METLYMGEEQIVVKIGEKEKTYPAGVSFLSIAQEYQDQYEDDIVLALYNNRLRELKKTIKKDGELSFLTTSDKTGKRAYRRSVTLLMQKAVYNLWGREHIGVYVRYAIGQGYYCELMKDGESCKITETMIGALKKEMYRLVMADFSSLAHPAKMVRIIVNIHSIFFFIINHRICCSFPCSISNTSSHKTSMSSLL